jgi:uncharacterized protein (TIGR01777 family)
MKIIIAGGTGFIGKHLSNHLHSLGHEIEIISRQSESMSKFPTTSMEECNGGDILINLAGSPIHYPWIDSVQTTIKQSRIDYTRNLVSYLKTKGIKKVIQASAIGWYGPQQQNNLQSILDEKSPFVPSFSHTLCDEWEKAALGFEKPTVALRFGIVLDPSGGILKKLLPAFKMGAGSIMGSGLQGCSWVSMHDVLKIITFAMDHDHTGVWNVTAPHPVSQEQFSKLLAAHLNKPCVIKVPEFALKLMPNNMAQELILNTPFVMPKALLELGFEFDHPNLEDYFKKEIPIS